MRPSLSKSPAVRAAYAQAREALSESVPERFEVSEDARVEGYQVSWLPSIADREGGDGQRNFLRQRGQHCRRSGGPPPFHAPSQVAVGSVVGEFSARLPSLTSEAGSPKPEPHRGAGANVDVDPVAEAKGDDEDDSPQDASGKADEIAAVLGDTDGEETILTAGDIDLLRFAETEAARPEISESMETVSARYRPAVSSVLVNNVLSSGPKVKKREPLYQFVEGGLQKRGDWRSALGNASMLLVSGFPVWLYLVRYAIDCSRTFLAWLELLRVKGSLVRHRLMGFLPGDPDAPLGCLYLWAAESQIDDDLMREIAASEDWEQLERDPSSVTPYGGYTARPFLIRKEEHLQDSVSQRVEAFKQELDKLGDSVRFADPLGFPLLPRKGLLWLEHLMLAMFDLTRYSGLNTNSVDALSFETKLQREHVRLLLVMFNQIFKDKAQQGTGLLRWPPTADLAAWSLLMAPILSLLDPDGKYGTLPVLPLSLVSLIHGRTWTRTRATVDTSAIPSSLGTNAPNAARPFSLEYAVFNKKRLPSPWALNNPFSRLSELADVVADGRSAVAYDAKTGQPVVAREIEKKLGEISGVRNSRIMDLTGAAPGAVVTYVHLDPNSPRNETMLAVAAVTECLRGTKLVISTTAFTFTGNESLDRRILRKIWAGETNPPTTENSMKVPPPAATPLSDIVDIKMPLIRDVIADAARWQEYVSNGSGEGGVFGDTQALVVEEVQGATIKTWI
ncbi:hypothetical protein A1Q1_04668 [Trichosporon asahii var. asahii CBS 2479]|uniref:Uncharacterized protein n=1 Tax=Trichosporon asahii var. asahii (strain ATCC 90039 / CBS 2479 / JCM 2466 / KCTC 7840 / NBRC 103889/ NCYC 2677 / UAMH 7654) TaxID=1186058 RepID=J5QCV1_TRIAS|nr:hypothetical protein A1Q1_04668 [Trichosporon asahii var. asahii CBS 2479]EJT46703.1 hypothetical protein A1Q1_04668 [Trichosporon asahii var. asahii CBS 2479]